MEDKYKTPDEKIKSDLAFGAAYYGALELQGRRANRKRYVPSGSIKFSSWEYNPIERVLKFEIYTQDKIPTVCLYVNCREAICTPSGSKEWTEAYTKLYEEFHHNDDKMDIIPLFVFERRRHIELEILEAFKPTIPRSFFGKLRFDKKIFYDLPAPSDDAPKEVMEFYLYLKGLVDRQNEELKDFCFDEDEQMKKLCPEKNDFVQAGHCFEKK